MSEAYARGRTDLPARQGGDLPSDFPPPGSAWPVDMPAEAAGRPAIAPAAGPGPALADQGASRLNAGKPPLHLLPPDALVMVARVLEFGAEKYQSRGWERGELSWADCCRAMLAHTWRVLGGQWLDPESGCPHVAHIACNALFVCAMAARGIGRLDVEGVDRAGYDAWQQTPEQAEAIRRVRAAKAARGG